jgi:predicted RNase H-like HicB family nuclease
VIAGGAFESGQVRGHGEPKLIAAGHRTVGWCRREFREVHHDAMIRLASDGAKTVEVWTAVDATGCHWAVADPVLRPAAGRSGRVRMDRLEELRTMTRAVHVPYTLEQDEDGVWCAHAQLRPGVGANGEGDTPEAAIADLREAVEGLIAEFGAPQELTLTVDVA